ncbi:hypothetical protein RND71_026719 [Anisodus tanguticus]|uniref:Uncharacterized protein n=1 Tax=Anisodus tanguticus TaxID=243964 RepID=A0AAE1RMX5_9SOLA|nr:hypothetical protein RND71_026719 [Anisodus tanguticus]
MGRKPCCSKEGLNKGAWTPIEDKILIDYIKVHGEGKWRNLPKRAGLKRCGKSCRLRWLNYLRPDIKRGNITPDEEDLIIRLHKLLGNRWSLIAGRLPGRTDNEIKNYWNTNIVKKLQEGTGSGQPSCITSLNCQRHRSNHAKSAKPSPIIQLQNDNQEHTVLQDSQLLTKVELGGSSSSSSPCLVVRTKALRCTKVFISPPTEPQNIDQSIYESAENDNNDKAMAEENVINTIVASSSSSLSISSLSKQQQQQRVPGSYSPKTLSGELENYNFNFMFGFDVDDHFLSELLNAPDLRDQILENTSNTVVADEVGDSNYHKNEKERSYFFLPSSNQTAIFSEETQHNDLELWINGFSS